MFWEIKSLIWSILSGKVKLVKPCWPKFTIWNFGLPVDRKCRVRSTGPRQKKKKIRAVEKCKVAFWPPPVPWLAPLTLGRPSTLGWVIPYHLGPIWSEKIVRESEPKKNSSWKTKCWPEEFHFGPPFSTLSKVVS